MNNEELKKKIVEVVNQWHMFQNSDMHGHTIWMTNDTEKIADALIAAGMGDVKEAEHRLTVAERALLTVCTNVVTDEEDDFAVEPRARVLYKAYLKQAEKELEEERKDD